MGNKNVYILSIVILLILGFSLQVFSQENAAKKDRLAAFSFSAEINKKEFILLEPLTIKFQVVNSSGKAINSYEPDFISQVRLKVTHKNKTFEIPNVFGLSVRSVRFSRSFEPGEKVEQNLILQPGSEFFAEPGSYTIQFILYGPDATEKVAADEFEIKIDQPVGDDKEAYEYLKKNRDASSPFLFSFCDNKFGSALPLQEDFIARFGSTPYGEYAILDLAKKIETEGDSERALSELKKIKNTSNKLLGAIVEEALSKGKK